MRRVNLSGLKKCDNAAYQATSADGKKRGGPAGQAFWPAAEFFRYVSRRID